MFLKLKGWFGPLISDRQIRVVFMVSAVLNVLIWVFILVRFWQLIIQNKIIGLHYSIYLGLDDIGSAHWVLIVPAIATGLAFFAVCAFAMGVDFPDSQRRFSRLSG